MVNIVKDSIKFFFKKSVPELLRLIFFLISTYFVIVILKEEFCYTLCHKKKEKKKVINYAVSQDIFNSQYSSYIKSRTIYYQYQNVIFLYHF